MGFLRRFLSVGLGLAAGAAAYKLMNDYNKKDGHIEGEYIEIDPIPHPAEPAEAVHVANASQADPVEAVRQAMHQKAPSAAAETAPCWNTASTPDGGPNPNPVSNRPAPERPMREDGKLDPTRIASQEDFSDWDDLGCQS